MDRHRVSIHNNIVRLPEPVRGDSPHSRVDWIAVASYSLHVKQKTTTLDGNQLLAVLSALANPHRLRILGLLHSGGRNYVSQLAREVGISRPLLHLHLQKLENAGLVTSQLELSNDGKALNYFEPTPFDIALTPAVIASAIASLTVNSEK